ncbi:hypothetical protein Cni_G27290 [Canna indica]|uniref:HTH myb-type domain-containing protein n=1 Tax=Canna indica TaxID=4628 RepID=A0AAQ3QR94_9LILI|nr:hypothetical protein Cni_G27290 [Canna indica]
MDFSAQLPSCSDYVHALEEERKKIQVFQRELPLCMQLVTHAIENVRKQMGGNATTRIDDVPVLEEFIPLKPMSPSSSGERSVGGDAERSASRMTESENKPDWLRSVQLWKQASDTPSATVAAPTKPIAVNAKKIGGAFHPFEREKHVAEPPVASAGTPVAASSSTSNGGGTDVDVGSGGGGEKDKEGQSQAHRKVRRNWSPELHGRFLRALEQLGGSHVATPKQIRELMKVDGLTNDEVKSHLQKYRLHNRRPCTSGVVQSNINSTAPIPQFVVGIWVPPADYTASPPASGPCAAPAGGGIFAPVTSPPSDFTYQQQDSKGHSKRSPTGPPHSKGRCMRTGENNSNGDTEANINSSSPSTSSSSQTTTASHHLHAS